MAKISNAIFTFFLISCVECSNNGVCVKQSACLCKFSEYSKIDLSLLLPPDPEHKKSFLRDQDHETVYNFHGCTDGDFNCTENNVTCVNNKALIQASIVIQNDTNATSLADSSQIKFEQVEGFHHQKLVYNIGEKVIATVELVCISYNKSFFKFLSNDTETYNFVLFSPHACIINEHQGMSAGSVIVILFITGLLVYFVFGGLFLYCIRGARGLELIPNVDFWRGLPGLVKDGVVFLLSGCNANIITTPETYDRI